MCEQRPAGLPCLDYEDILWGHPNVIVLLFFPFVRDQDEKGWDRDWGHDASCPGTTVEAGLSPSKTVGFICINESLLNYE